VTHVKSEDITAGFTGRSKTGRKLIAVLYADMVGYSRLIGLDERGTLERLRTLRSHLIDPSIQENGGTRRRGRGGHDLRWVRPAYIPGQHSARRK
jgi:class 3 adenylate cyclase